MGITLAIKQYAQNLTEKKPPFVLNINKYTPPGEVKTKTSRIHRGKEGVKGHWHWEGTAGSHPVQHNVHQGPVATMKAEPVSLSPFLPSAGMVRLGLLLRLTPGYCNR